MCNLQDERAGCPGCWIGDDEPPEISLIALIDCIFFLYWDNDPVSQETLHERLHAQARRDPEVAVRLAADAGVPYQAVIHLLDLCQFEGLTHVALQARAGS